MKKDVIALIKGNNVADLERRDGATYFSVTSDGKTKTEWVDYFKSVGHKIQHCTKDALLSPWFKTTRNKTYKIIIVRDHTSKDMCESMTKNLEEINKRNLDFFNLEAACLVWRKWNEISKRKRKALGFNEVVIMIYTLDSEGDRSRLRTFRLGRGPRSRGLAYIVP